jgi:hypothetical protein
MDEHVIQSPVPDAAVRDFAAMLRIRLTAIVALRLAGTFRDALVRTLEPHLVEGLGPLDELLDQASHLGESGTIVDAALDIWRAARARHVEARGVAT